MRRTITILLVLGLVAGAMTAPADAAKKKKKKKKAAVCKPYEPGEAGAEKPLVVVTDKATDQAPAVQKVALAESAADFVPMDPGQDAFNVQVDTANPEAGLYVLFEFPSRRDYDLELMWPDGSYAARSHDFNLLYSPVPETYSNEGHAGESTDASEMTVGVRTPDCGGYTVEAFNWLGEGGDFEIKLWLGEIKNDPQAPGEETP